MTWPRSGVAGHEGQLEDRSRTFRRDRARPYLQGPSIRPGRGAPGVVVSRQVVSTSLERCLYKDLVVSVDTMTIDEIRDNFALLEDWDDRYRYVIELGRTLDPMPEAEHSAANKVQGCASQVWLSRKLARNGTGEPVLSYLGDSDAHIVRGLIAILLTLYSGRTPQEILSTDAIAVFDEFGFREHLTPQRSNGLRAMVERIRTDARQTLAAAS